MRRLFGTSVASARQSRFLLAAAVVAATLCGQGPPPPPPPPPPPALPPLPVPAGNPITEGKRVLGKILFWDEQLSHDDTVACGTCHRSEFGGIDPRTAVSPGADGVFGTVDDHLGSIGVVRSDSARNYSPSPVFGLFAQVTGRYAPSFDSAAYAPSLFWDGRATGTLLDPDTGLVALASGAALESQSLGPILNDGEMAHVGRTFAQATTKLAAAKPLKLATNLPADVAAVLAADPSYPDLFSAAFGDPAITAVRIAFAIATYERTLYPNQTPFDAWAAGNPTALTPNQLAGFGDFNGPGRCNQCHTGVTFTDNQFHNLGLRPIAQDNGRQGFTGLFADRGKFKTPSLRNAALRPNYMHNGDLPSVAAVLNFYNADGGPNLDNKDPILNGLNINAAQRARIEDFLNALVDPRTVAGTFPFDRPTLYGETHPLNGNLYGQATAGTGNRFPAMFGISPAALGAEFRIGLANALGSSPAVMGVTAASLAPAVSVGGFLLNLDPSTALLLVEATTGGAGAGGGFATTHFTLPTDPAFAGFPFFAQWFVVDPAASGGISASQGASFQIF